MRVPRLIFVFVFCQLAVHAALPTCDTFGNNLVQATGTQAPGLYTNIGNAASCAGNATAWNVCYYSARSDRTMISYFAVYRPATGSNYRRIGSAATYTATRNTAITYVCDRVPIPQSDQYVVQPQDVLAVCLKSVGSGYQGMVASPVTGASVLMATSACASANTAMANNLNIGVGFNTISSTTVHISIDVNECAVNNGGCGQVCTDSTPGYACSCNPGYMLNPDGMSCSDINECLSNNGNCSQVCTNTNGSYYCSCYPGYLLQPDGKTCTDINECAVQNGNCSQLCVNTNGSYYCSCYPGYRLNQDNKTCDDINECATANGNCSQICINTNGSYFCVCYPGYFLEQDGKTCTDVDECAYLNGNCSQICVNTIGTYHCSCNCSYRLGADNSSCYFQCPTNLPPHLILEGSAYVNTQATFSCPQGYGLVGNTTLQCASDGTWSAGFPQCVEGVCPLALGGSTHLQVHGSAEYGSTNTFYCDFGYALSGNAIQTCQSDGTWSGDLPTCDTLTCDPLQLPSNGRASFVYVNNFASNPVPAPGDSASFDCDEGYVLVGCSSTVCLDTGIWSAPVPTCVPAICPSNKDTHLHMEGSGAVNTSVTFSCELGYVLNGSPSLTCNPDVTWNGDLPTCTQVLCPQVTPPPKVSVVGNSNTVGSSLTFSCGQGYTLTGPTTIACQTNGSWSGPVPSCDLANCPFASGDTHLHMVGSGAVNTSVTFSCELGYVLNGSPSRTCSPDVTWNDDLPTCTQVLCPQVTPPPKVSVVGNSNTVGSSLTFSCGQGYTLTGPTTIACQTNGSWSGPVPSCDLAKCPFNSGDTHLHMEGSGAVNTSVTFSCELGYVLTGSPSLTCNPDVTWNGDLPTCTQVLCPQVTPPPESSVVGDSNTVGSSLTFSCDQGYTLTGPTTIACQTDGSWSGPVPSCIATNCSLITSDPHLHTKGSGEVGTSVRFTCDFGYVLNGSETLTCDSSIIWSGPFPSCTEVLCPEVYPPPLGFVVTGNASNSRPGDAIVFSCEEGYALKGPEAVVCQGNGAWSSPVPSCIVVNCSSDLAGPNLQTTPIGHTPVGTNVSFSCDFGYTLNGSSFLVCMSTGQWSGPLPSCDQILCPTILPLHNGQVFGSGTSIGSIATFSCNAGYSLVGSNMITCQNDGMWDGAPPTCQIAQCPPFSDPHLHVNGTRDVRTNVTVWCDPIYTLSGGLDTDTIGCAPDGTWSRIPSCVINVCAAINVSALTDTIIATERYDKLFGPIPGSYVTFGCEEGSTVVVESIYCLSHGNWSAKPPFCFRAPVPHLPTGENANVGLIAGATVSGILVVVVVIVVIVIIWKRKRRGATEIGLSIKAEDTAHLLDDDDGSTNL
eukprot:Em0008g882a